MVESKHKWKAWLYLAPAMVLLLIFTVWPIINTLRIAFLDGYNMLGEIGGESYSFGIKNFTDVLKAFEDVQKVTHCSTGCGGCYQKVLDIISKEMMG